jgi:hypothetical protein
MTDNDFNPIRPVENLQNVIGLTPTSQHQERKRRQNASRRDQETQTAPPDKTREEQTPARDDDAHVIDYRA